MWVIVEVDAESRGEDSFTIIGVTETKEQAQSMAEDEHRRDEEGIEEESKESFAWGGGNYYGPTHDNDWTFYFMIFERTPGESISDKTRGNHGESQ